MTQIAAPRLLERPAVQQFLKFCLIGASSAIIDLSISGPLILHFNINPTLAKSISFLVAVTNGFFWNSRWTFRGMGSGRLHEMYVKFIMVNMVGFVLNISLFKLAQVPFTGRFIGQGKPTLPVFLLAFSFATICGAFWNFTANRKWTFSHKVDSGDSVEYPVRSEH